MHFGFPYVVSACFEFLPFYLLNLFFNLALCLEHGWMGEADKQVHAGPDWTSNGSSCRYSCPISPRSETSPCRSRDPDSYI